MIGSIEIKLNFPFYSERSPGLMVYDMEIFFMNRAIKSNLLEIKNTKKSKKIYPIILILM